MMDSKIKGLVFCSLVALFASGQAFAHTGVKEAIIAGEKSFNGFVISHGCGDNTQTGTVGADQYPVTGQSFIAPYGSSAIWREDGGRPKGHGLNNPVLVPGVNNFSIPVSGTFNLGIDSLAGSSSPFASVREIVDAAGVARGLVWSNGALEPKLRAVTPFYLVAPAITDNCVSAIKVRMAVINYCDVNQNASTDTNTGPYKAPKDAYGRPVPLAYASTVNGGIQRNVLSNTAKYVAKPGGNGRDNRADWWFYGTGSTKYIDPSMAEDVEAAQFWTTLTINQTAANLALCSGTKHALTVEPSGADIDTYLSGPNTWPFSLGDSNL
jgi:hypothetical protein